MKNILILILFFLCNSILSQEDINFSKPTNREILVNYEDSVVKINVVLKPKKLSITNELTYYWYFSGTIGQNRGGFHGQLLHGDYLVLDHQNRMLCNGNFKLGLKDGEWKRWHRNGNLKEITNFKNGQKHGKQELFDVQGKLINVKNFKKDVLTSEEIYFADNKTVSKKYKDGKEILPKETKKEDLSSNQNKVSANDTTKKKGFFKFFSKSGNKTVDKKATREPSKANPSQVKKEEVSDGEKKECFIKKWFKKKPKEEKAK